MSAAVRRADLSALALLAVTVGVAIAAYPSLPGVMRVGWHVGLDGGVRVTRAPRAVGGVLVPALAVGAYAVLRGVAALSTDVARTRRTRRLVDAVCHATLAVCLVVEAALLAVNL
ncbi:hypothetical protein [Haloarcula litorea]|uniref:hypothetical protein n=1 Tax=Haloarcula litorea TaxID=3032579 RepID=UPI0023E8977F|nr:hypothetical protein [Halomicroarcula sp. GDY20]